MDKPAAGNGSPERRRLRVVLAQPRGFCAGVERAIENSRLARKEDKGMGKSLKGEDKQLEKIEKKKRNQ